MSINIPEIKNHILADLQNIHGPDDIAGLLDVSALTLREQFRQKDPDRLWMFIQKRKTEDFWQQLPPDTVPGNPEFLHVEKFLDSYRSVLLEPDSTWAQCVQRIIRLIHVDPFNKDLRVDWIKEKLRISDESCTQKFYHFTHMSVLEYIRWHRLAVARYLLIHSSLTMVEIALLIGYDSGSTFSKAFTRDMGHSPKEYRQGIRRL